MRIVVLFYNEPYIGDICKTESFDKVDEGTRDLERFRDDIDAYLALTEMIEALPDFNDVVSILYTSQTSRFICEHQIQIYSLESLQHWNNAYQT